MEHFIKNKNSNVLADCKSNADRRKNTSVSYWTYMQLQNLEELTLHNLE